MQLDKYSGGELWDYGFCGCGGNRKRWVPGGATLSWEHGTQGHSKMLMMLVV
jgi:hypothetical protein